MYWWSCNIGTRPVPFLIDFLVSVNMMKFDWLENSIWFTFDLSMKTHLQFISMNFRWQFLSLQFWSFLRIKRKWFINSFSQIVFHLNFLRPRFQISKATCQKISVSSTAKQIRNVKLHLAESATSAELTETQYTSPSNWDTFHVQNGSIYNDILYAR